MKINAAHFTLCVGVAVATPAHAQQPDAAPTATMPQAEEPAEEPSPHIYPRDWTVSLGLGAMALTGEVADDAADLGASYQLRIGLDAPIAGLRFEGAYIGSSHSIVALGIDRGANLTTNGLELVAKYDFARWVDAELGPMRVAPFVFAGLAYMRFGLTDEGLNTSDIAGSDNVIAIPVGAGAAGSWDRWVVDASFTWRSTFDEDLFRGPDLQSADASLSHWVLGANVGVGF